MAKCVYTIDWCVYSLSRTDHSVSDSGNKELKLLHSASLFNPDFHVFFALVLSSYVSFSLSAHSSYRRLNLSLFHLTGELCKWVLSSKALWKQPKQTVVWISNTKNIVFFSGKTLQRMLTALWFCHRQTKQKEIVIIFYSCFLFISHDDSVWHLSKLTYWTPYTLTFPPFCQELKLTKLKKRKKWLQNKSPLNATKSYSNNCSHWL